jgi:DNA-binding CsgD family transcriptional regulator
VIAGAKAEGRKERYLILILVVANLSLLVVRAVTTVGLWGGVREDMSFQPLEETLETLAACLVFCVIAWFALIQRSEVPLHARWQVPLLVLIAGCVAYLINTFAFPLSQFALERVAVVAIELFGHLLLWTITVSSIRALRFSPYRILGCTAMLYSLLAITWITFFEKSTNIMPTLVLIVLYLVVFFVAIAPLGIRETPRTESPGTYLWCAEEYGLTQRELEILGLLIQGRNRPYIQEKLHLADGTVKTHTTHIYTKLGVHTRQELIDFIQTRNTSEAQG